MTMPILLCAKCRRGRSYQPKTGVRLFDSCDVTLNCTYITGKTSGLAKDGVLPNAIKSWLLGALYTTSG